LGRHIVTTVCDHSLQRVNARLVQAGHVTTLPNKSAKMPWEMLLVEASLL